MSDLSQGRIVAEREVSNVFGVRTTTITGITEPTISHDRYKIQTPDDITLLEFHTGALVDGQANGLLNETLIDVLIHRLECQQAAIPCDETLAALEALTQARNALDARANRRVQEMA